MTFVATAPEARGRGLASALLATLWPTRASAAAEQLADRHADRPPVYERLGYRAVGTIQMWERREPVEG